MKKAIFAASLLVFSAGAAQADAIEGMWKRPNEILVRISACGDAFCVVAASGPNKGKSAGKMSAKGGGSYAGSVTELDTGKTYTGKASVSGGALSMSGCILGGLICRSETWTRQ